MARKKQTAPDAKLLEQRRKEEIEEEKIAAAEKQKQNSKKRKEIEAKDAHQEKKIKTAVVPSELFAEPEVFTAAFQKVGSQVFNSELLFSVDMGDAFHPFLFRVAKAIIEKFEEGNVDLGEAVQAVLPGRLGRDAVKEFVERGESFQLTEESKNLLVQMTSCDRLRLPDKEKLDHKQFYLAVEFVLVELLENIGNMHRDRLTSHVGTGLTDALVHRDLILIKQALATGEHKFEDPEDEESAKLQVKELLEQRYLPVPLLYVHEVIFENEDFKELATNLFTEAELEALFPRDLMSRSENEKAILGSTDYSKLSNGVGSRPYPKNTTFPGHSDLSLLRYFCLQHEVVDHVGVTEEDEDRMFTNPCDAYEEMLAKVREAKKDEASGKGADFEGEVPSHDYTLHGCSSLQLFGALVFQQAAGNVGVATISWEEGDSRSQFLAKLLE